MCLEHLLVDFINSRKWWPLFMRLLSSFFWTTRGSDLTQQYQCTPYPEYHGAISQYGGRCDVYCKITTSSLLKTLLREQKLKKMEGDEIKLWEPRRFCRSILRKVIRTTKTGHPKTQTMLMQTADCRPCRLSTFFPCSCFCIYFWLAYVLVLVTLISVQLYIGVFVHR